MKDNPNIQTSFETDREKEWLEKKKIVLERFAADRKFSNFDNISSEKRKLEVQIEKNEESNNLMTKYIKDLQHQISEKKKKSQKVFRKADDLKKKITVLQTQEKSLFNELTFLESEESELKSLYSNASEGLETSIMSLDKSVNDIGFIKGETSSLIQKMSILEGKIPGKNVDVEHIDGMIQETILSLSDLYERMQGIEKKVKASYYQNRKK